MPHCLLQVKSTQMVFMMFTILSHHQRNPVVISEKWKVTATDQQWCLLNWTLEANCLFNQFWTIRRTLSLYGHIQLTNTQLMKKQGRSSYSAVKTAVLYLRPTKMTLPQNWGFSCFCRQFFLAEDQTQPMDPHPISLINFRLLTSHKYFGLYNTHVTHL